MDAASHLTSLNQSKCIFDKKFVQLNKFAPVQFQPLEVAKSTMCHDVKGFSCVYKLGLIIKSTFH